MDTAAFLTEEMWNKLKIKTGWSNVQLRDCRYDAILHMITAADGAEEFYAYDNPARFHPPEEAIKVDKALRAAYLGHNQVFYIENRTSFKEKIRYCINAIC